MKTRAYLALLVLFAATASLADEILPALSQEKMSEYKNAFGRAIQESRDSESGGKGSPLSALTQKLRDDLGKNAGHGDGRGSGPGFGRGHDPHDDGGMPSAPRHPPGEGQGPRPGNVGGGLGGGGGFGGGHPPRASLTH